MKITHTPEKKGIVTTEKVVLVETEVVLQEESYRVDFTRDELKTFYVVAQVVGGSPTDSPRRVFEEFNKTVRSVAPDVCREVASMDHGRVPPRPGDGPTRFLGLTGSAIWFEDGSIND